jgi:hypothetical protein
MSDSLQETEKLVIRQQFQTIEVIANAAANAVDLGALGNLGETANKYDVFTDDGGEKYKVIESSDYLMRCCCNPNHKLQLHVFQPEASKDQEVMMFDRPCKCGQCCACHDICRQEMTVYEGGGESNKIGYIKQPFLGGFLSPTLEMMDREGDEPTAIIKANAVCCIGGLCCDHTFEVTDPSGASLGKIVKERPESLGEFAKELVSDADVFSLDMNKDLDPKKKATMFAALHLIDYMFFENEGEFECDVVNGACSFKCCDMYCLGCSIPCACNCGGGNSDGDDGDD